MSRVADVMPLQLDPFEAHLIRAQGAHTPGSRREGDEYTHGHSNFPVFHGPISDADCRKRF
jgi:hypothetical protein